MNRHVFWCHQHHRCHRRRRQQHNHWNDQNNKKNKRYKKNIYNKRVEHKINKQLLCNFLHGPDAPWPYKYKQAGCSCQPASQPASQVEPCDIIIKSFDMWVCSSSQSTARTTQSSHSWMLFYSATAKCRRQTASSKKLAYKQNMAFEAGARLGMMMMVGQRQHLINANKRLN